MSKVYPKHGTIPPGRPPPAERIRPSHQQPRGHPHQQQQQQQRAYSQRQRQSAPPTDDMYWPSLFTILCSVPVIFVLFHAVKNLLAKVVWGTLPISVEVSGPRIDHPFSANEESLYQWLMEWFAKHLKNLQNTTVQLNKRNGRLIRYPGFGVTNFQFKGTWLKLERIQMPEIRCNDIPYEKIILSFPSTRGTRTLLYELLEECRPSSKKKRLEEGEERTVVYEVDPKAPKCWKAVASKGKRKRQLNSVIVGDEGKDKLMKDLKEFLDSRDWYEDRGIPYRRGYLFYGPTGCGKTSLAKGLAGEYDFDVCYLPLCSGIVNDDNLVALMSSTPDNCILLLEDVDIVMGTGAQRSFLGEASHQQSTVTLSGLLNAIDGLKSPNEEGKIVIMTTSQVEKLDASLTRPGRVDMKIFLGYPNDEQIRAIYARFYPEVGSKMKSEFVKRVRELGINVTMAQMQGLFALCKKDGIDAMSTLQEYFQDQFLISEIEPNK